MTRHCIAGENIKNMLDAERAQLPQAYKGALKSEPLCAWQRSVSNRGLIEAEICQTIYGYSLRYASGLQNFGLIQGRINTFPEAVEAAKAWVSRDPDHRWVTCYPDLIDGAEAA